MIPTIKKIKLKTMCHKLPTFITDSCNFKLKKILLFAYIWVNCKHNYFNSLIKVSAITIAVCPSIAPELHSQSQ